MIDWLNARYEGVLLARQEAEREGITGVSVQDVAQFLDLNGAQQDQPSMLRDVLPHVNYDLLSYSSYDSMNKNVPVSQLGNSILRDIAFIRNYPGLPNKPLIIGEYGFSPDQFSDAPQRAVAATQAFMQAGIPLASYWDVEDDQTPTFGLYDTGGTTLSSTGAMLQTMINSPLGSVAPAVRSPATAVGKGSMIISSNDPSNYAARWQASNPIAVNAYGRPISSDDTSLMAANNAIRTARQNLIRQ